MQLTTIQATGTATASGFPNPDLLRTELAKLQVGFGARMRTGEVVTISLDASIDSGERGSKLIRAYATDIQSAMKDARRYVGEFGRNQAMAVLQAFDGSWWLGKLRYDNPGWETGNPNDHTGRLNVPWSRKGVEGMRSAIALDVSPASIIRGIVDVATQVVVDPTIEGWQRMPGVGPKDDGFVPFS